MSAITRWSVRTIAATAVLGIASVTAHAQFRFPVAQPQPPKANPIVIPPGPKVPQSGIPHIPGTNPVRVQPQINSFPGFQTYPAVNPFTPSVVGNPFATPYYNPARVNPPFQPGNPFQFGNPFVNPFNPLNNPLVNNNPFINNNPLINNNPFINPLQNPFLLNPFAVNPLVNTTPLTNPFVPNPFINPFAQPVIGAVQPAAYQPGTLVMAGPNTFVNNSTGEVSQPITGTTFADGTTFYRTPTISAVPPAYGYPRSLNGGIFTPYIW